MAEEYMGKNEERVSDMADAKMEVDRWDIEINYGYGWEVETSEYTREDAIRSLQEYKENVEKYGKGEVRMTEYREREAVVEKSDEYAEINDVDERMSMMNEESRDSFIQKIETSMDYNEKISAEEKELYEKILEERKAGIKNNVEIHNEKKNDIGMEMLSSFSEIAAEVKADIIQQSSETGIWQSRIANRSRPQDYLQIEIEGNNKTHDIKFKTNIIHANEFEESKSFIVKTDTANLEKSVNKAFENVCREFELNVEEILEKLDTEMNSIFITYSPFTEHSLDEHYDRLNGLGYESEPSYELYNLNKSQVDKKDEKDEMIETNIGEMPLKDYLEIQAQQCGFASYEDLKAAGLSISIDKSNEKKEKNEEQKKEASDLHKRKLLQGHSR